MASIFDDLPVPKLRGEVGIVYRVRVQVLDTSDINPYCPPDARRPWPMPNMRFRFVDANQRTAAEGCTGLDGTLDLSLPAGTYQPFTKDPRYDQTDGGQHDAPMGTVWSPRDTLQKLHMTRPGAGRGCLGAPEPGRC